MRSFLMEYLFSLLYLIPGFLLLNTLVFRNGRIALRYFVFTSYLAAVYVIVGLPTVGFLTFDVHVNLIPTLLTKVELRYSILNVILFLPLGFLLPALWNSFRKASGTLLCGFLASLSIELLQLFTYRISDVNDLITNSTGALLGYLAYKAAQHMTGGRIRPAGQSKDLKIILLTLWIVMFFLQPVTVNLFYIFF